MHLRKTILSIGGVALLHIVAGNGALAADATSTAATAINALGIDLLAQVAKPNANALISPYSIQSALAMTYAGAAGETKTEMARVLHYPADEAELHRSFAAFRKELEEIHDSTAKQVQDSAGRGGPSEPVTIESANRLYGQSGYAFRPEFLALVKDSYGAPFQPVDFMHAAEDARSEINHWVSARTHERINDLIPPDGVNETTRLALANAIYFKAAWAKEFKEAATRAEPFFVNGTAPVNVQTMQREGRYGYMRGDGFCAITVRYVGEELELLILLPDEKDGLAALEAKLTPQLLADCANPGPNEFILHLPRFKLEPPLISLGGVLQSLGMKTAFDRPRRSANFDRMAPRKPDDYLCISEVFHKTYLALDENGTEATAATAVTMLDGFGVTRNPPKPIEIKVDHPFLFAIQHRASGACLFLGRVVDPR
jgi:serpin B